MNVSDTTVTTPSSQRTRSLTAGIFYLLTFVSIPTLALYDPVKSANYIIGTGPDTRAIIGGILEIIVALAGIGTAVVLFPILKKQNESAALGLVAARVLESGTIFVGVAFLLSIVTLRRTEREQMRWSPAMRWSPSMTASSSSDKASCRPYATCCLDLCCTSRAWCRRRLSLIGIVGAPILVAGYLAVLFGLIGQHGPLAGLSAFPVAIFEFSLGVWLIVKGFNPEAVAALESKS